MIPEPGWLLRSADADAQWELSNAGRWSAPWKRQCPLGHDRQKRNTERGERANRLQRTEGRAGAAEESGSWDLDGLRYPSLVAECELTDKKMKKRPFYSRHIDCS